jgi:RNA polymerase sigma factor (sigma-70 family)
MARAAMSWDETKGPWRPWLVLQVRTAIMHALRDLGRHPQPDASLDAPVAEHANGDPITLAESLPSPDPAVSPEERCDLRAALARLDRRSRLILHLYYADGRTETQIGQSIGFSQAHTGRLIRNALKTLKEAM